MTSTLRRSRSAHPSRKARVLAALLCSVALPGCGASVPRAAEPVEAEQILEDFEDGGGWAALPHRAEDRIRIQVGRDPSGERPGRSLRLGLALTW